LLAKVNTYWYQPHYMDKVDDANTRIQFLAPHFIPGNFYGNTASGSDTFTLDRMTGSNLGLNIFFTETGVENKPQGLLGLTSISTPYRKDSVTSIVFANIDFFIIRNNTSDSIAPWCVIPVGGDSSPNNILCVPSEENAHQLVDALATLAVAYGKDIFPYPGMEMSEISEKYQHKHPEQSGCLVGQVYVDGPAAQAGIREGDDLRTVNGTPCGANTAIKDTTLAATAKPQGGMVRVEILRKNSPLAIDLAFPHVEVPAAQLRQQVADLARRNAAPEAAVPSQGVAPAAPPSGVHFGFNIRPVNQDDVAALALTKAQGIVVVSVEKTSLAETMGILPDDVILAVNGAEIGNLPQFVQTVRGGAATSFRVWRKGKTLELAVPMSM
jgi:S1-C subfamily serine protease